MKGASFLIWTSECEAQQDALPGVGCCCWVSTGAIPLEQDSGSFAVWAGDRGTSRFPSNICISQSALGKQWFAWKRQSSFLIDCSLKGGETRGRDQYLCNAKSSFSFLSCKPPWFQLSECDHSARWLFYTGSVPAGQCAQLHPQPLSENVQMERAGGERWACGEFFPDCTYSDKLPRIH